MTSCQSELSDQEKSVSWSSTRTDWKATNVSQSPQYSQEGKQKGSQNHVGQIPEQSAFSRLIDSHCMGWEHLYCIWRDRKRGPFLRCDKRRKKPKWEITTSERDDNQEAKKTCNKLYKEYAATAECGNTRIIHPQEHVRQGPNQEFEVHEEDSCRIDSETGWKYCILATRSSSPSSAWCRPSDS